MPSVLSGNVTLAALVVGDGDPVTVVAHGLAGRKEDLSLLAPLVPGATVLFDFRGHGESDRPPRGSYSMDDFAADVDAVAAAHGATRAVGVSLGGGATLRLLLSQPDRFERLVFVLPARLGRSDATRAKLLRLASLLETRPLDEVAEAIVAEEEEQGVFDGFGGALDRRRASILTMNADGIPHAIRESLDDPPIGGAETLSRVTAPSLVIGQEGDPVHPADAARDLAAALPAGELVLYPDRTSMARDVLPLTQRVAAFIGEEG